MSILLSKMPVNSVGQSLLPRKYQNGLAVVAGFDTSAELVVELGQDISPGYNAVGTFYIISNAGDDVDAPDLIVSTTSMDILDVTHGGVHGDISIPWGGTLIIGVEDASQTTASGILFEPSSGGGYTLPAATAGVLGGVKIGTGVTVSADGTISVSGYTLPAATAAVRGGVKVGTGLTIAADVLSATPYVLPAATAAVTGGVKQSVAQADSVAADVAGLVTDFNALLAKLRTSGQLAP